MPPQRPETHASPTEFDIHSGEAVYDFYEGEETASPFFDRTEPIASDPDIISPPIPLETERVNAKIQPEKIEETFVPSETIASTELPPEIINQYGAGHYEHSYAKKVSYRVDLKTGIEYGLDGKAFDMSKATETEIAENNAFKQKLIDNIDSVVTFVKEVKTEQGSELHINLFTLAADGMVNCEAWKKIIVDEKIVPPATPEKKSDEGGAFDGESNEGIFGDTTAVSEPLHTTVPTDTVGSFSETVKPETAFVVADETTEAKKEITPKPFFLPSELKAPTKSESVQTTVVKKNSTEIPRETPMVTGPINHITEPILPVAHKTETTVQKPTEIHVAEIAKTASTTSEISLPIAREEGKGAKKITIENKVFEDSEVEHKKETETVVEQSKEMRLNDSATEKMTAAEHAENPIETDRIIVQVETNLSNETVTIAESKPTVSEIFKDKKEVVDTITTVVPKMTEVQSGNTTEAPKSNSEFSPEVTGISLVSVEDRETHGENSITLKTDIGEAEKSVVLQTTQQEQTAPTNETIPEIKKTALEIYGIDIEPITDDTGAEKPEIVETIQPIVETVEAKVIVPPPVHIESSAPTNINEEIQNVALILKPETQKEQIDEQVSLSKPVEIVLSHTPESAVIEEVTTELVSPVITAEPMLTIQPQETAIITPAEKTAVLQRPEVQAQHHDESQAVGTTEKNTVKIPEPTVAVQDKTQSPPLPAQRLAENSGPNETEKDEVKTIDKNVTVETPHYVIAEKISALKSQIETKTTQNNRTHSLLQSRRGGLQPRSERPTRVKDAGNKETITITETAATRAPNFVQPQRATNLDRLVNALRPSEVLRRVARRPQTIVTEEIPDITDATTLRLMHYAGRN